MERSQHPVHGAPSLRGPTSSGPRSRSSRISKAILRSPLTESDCSEEPTFFNEELAGWQLAG